MMTSPKKRAGSPAGFALLEALIALLVASFGLLAIAAFQGTLSSSSDIAKQRSEAVRLAQLKIEQLRAYEQVAADAGKFDFAEDVVSGSDTVGPASGYSTNTTYTRVWTVAGGVGDPQKWVRVNVSWPDRSGNTQNVSLQTVIAKSDPIAIGTLAVGPGGVNARTPKNRNVDIPYPAISLAGGKSGFQPGSDTSPNPNPYFVFDDVTGDVLGYCNNALTAGQAVVLNPNDSGNTAGCFTQKALLLSGYIRFALGQNYNSNNVDTVFGNPTGDTRTLDARVDFASPTTGATATCYTQRQRVVSYGTISVRTISSASRSSGITTIVTSGNHQMEVGQYVSINDLADNSANGTFVIASTPNNTTFTYQQPGLGALSSAGGNGTITPTATLVQQIAIGEGVTAPTGYNDVKSRYVAYACIVIPVDHDSNPDTKMRWSGTFRITPTAGAGAWSLGSGNNDIKLCRYTGDYYTDGVLSNSEHPLTYRGVTGALDNQNYVVYDGSCPTDGPANTATSNYVNSNTTVHQTSTTGGGQRSGSNSGGSSNNGGLPSGAEADSYADDFAFPMFRVGD